jgi:hypothetical protein
MCLYHVTMVYSSWCRTSLDFLDFPGLPGPQWDFFLLSPCCTPGTVYVPAAAAGVYTADSSEEQLSDAVTDVMSWSEVTIVY